MEKYKLASRTSRFLLPALQIQSILEEPSISKRRAALKTMPKELDDAFLVTIERINRQPPEKLKQGMQILKWTYLAQRQLTITELRHAIATTDSTAESFDSNDRTIATVWLFWTKRPHQSVWFTSLFKTFWRNYTTRKSYFQPVTTTLPERVSYIWVSMTVQLRRRIHPSIWKQSLT